MIFKLMKVVRVTSGAARSSRNAFVSGKFQAIESNWPFRDKVRELEIVESSNGNFFVVGDDGVMQEKPLPPFWALCVYNAIERHYEMINCAEKYQRSVLVR